MAKVIALKWTLGFNKQEAGLVHSLAESGCAPARFFCASGTVGVVREAPQKQLLLAGHGNRIVAASVTADRAFVATGDRCDSETSDGSSAQSPSAGDDAAPMVALWDTHTGRAVFRIVRPHPLGVAALDVSLDGSFIATLSAPQQGCRQTVALWKRGGGATPMASAELPVPFEVHALRISPSEPTLIAATGARGVVFVEHTPGNAQLRAVAPPLTMAGQSLRAARNAECICTAFLPRTKAAVTSTADGELLLWEGASAEKRAVKAVRLHEAPIRVLTTVADRYLVTGSDDGFVRFYDTQLRLLAWLEHLAAGPIVSVSFDNAPAGDVLSTEFSVPHMLVATRAGIIKVVDPMTWEKRVAPGEEQGTVLVAAQDGPIHALAASPLGRTLAVGGHTGLVQLWTLETRALVASTRLDRFAVSCVVFTADSNHVAVGSTNGSVRLLSATDLSEEPGASWHNSKSCITQLASCSGFLAAADADRCVMLFRQDSDSKAWSYIAKYRSHAAPISALLLVSSGMPTATPSSTQQQQQQQQRGCEELTARLLSIGEDRRVVEYDLRQCSASGGLAIKSSTEIEQEAVPTAACWLARPSGSSTTHEELLLVANNQFKLRLHSAHTKSCRRTALAPLFSGPIGQLVAVPGGQAVAFAAHERIAGLVALPVDGNPRRTAGVVAHAGPIACIAVSPDGRWMFTAGGADQSVCAWRIDAGALATATPYVRDDTEESIEAFTELLEGGKDGQLWREMVDYFRFAQIRAAGEASTEPFSIGPTIPLSQLPDVMRALGVFLSEREIEDLVNEVKFSRFAETGAYVDTVTFPTLVRLYANHRSVFGVTKELIDNAFRALGATDATDGRLPWAEVALALQFKGEPMAEDELRSCLDALLGAEIPAGQVVLSHPVGAREFAESILGFEDYNGAAAVQSHDVDRS